MGHRLQRAPGRRRLREVLVLLPHQGRAMQQKPSVSSKNRILSRLSADDKAFLKPDLEPVDLALRQVLETPNKPIKHSYFIEYGLASIVASNGHKQLEVGLIGCKGVTVFRLCSAMTGLPTRPSCKWSRLVGGGPGRAKKARRPSSRDTDDLQLASSWMRDAGAQRPREGRG